MRLTTGTLELVYIIPANHDDDYLGVYKHSFQRESQSETITEYVVLWRSSNGETGQSVKSYGKLDLAISFATTYMIGYHYGRSRI